MARNGARKAFLNVLLCTGSKSALTKILRFLSKLARDVPRAVFQRNNNLRLNEMAQHLIRSDRTIQTQQPSVKRLDDGGGLHLRIYGETKVWYQDCNMQTAHGFRATARTILIERRGWHEAIVELQLDNAVLDANGRAYNRTQLDAERREMLQA